MNRLARKGIAGQEEAVFVLVELGASCPARGLYLLETDYTSSEVIDPWVARAKPFL